MHDKITEVTKAVDVEKNIDTIEHVEKFNPFHDSLGRFSSARGMASYSANPKTKAGQMAIGRSASAGHGKVLNIHRESKGENIGQNDTWIKTGQKPTLAQTQRNQINQARQKQWRQQQNQNAKQTAQQSQTQTQSKPKAQTANQQTQQAQMTHQQMAQYMLQTSLQLNPNLTPQQQQSILQTYQKWSPQKLQSAVQSHQTKQQQAQQQLAQQQTQAAKKAVNVKQKMNSGITMDVDFDTTTVVGALNKEFRGTANGKDLTKTFDATKMKATDSYNGWDRFTDKAADMQGFNSPMKKVSKTEWDQLAKDNGDVFQREVDSAVINGRRVTAKGMKDAYSTENDLKMNGTGGRVYGDGIYTASASMMAHNSGGQYKDHLDATAQKKCRSDIYGYGDGQTVLKMAWLSKPNIANENVIRAEFNKLSPAERAKFGNHLNTYACAKGYDAMRTSTSCYMVVFNRSKVAVLDD